MNKPWWILLLSVEKRILLFSLDWVPADKSNQGNILKGDWIRLKYYVESLYAVHELRTRNIRFPVRNYRKQFAGNHCPDSPDSDAVGLVGLDSNLAPNYINSL